MIFIVKNEDGEYVATLSNYADLAKVLQNNPYYTYQSYKLMLNSEEIL